MQYKSPLNWYGGKYYQAKNIIALFPEHRIYVEGFGGAAHILFKKQPSAIEVYNDIHEGLYLFFKLLRDDSKRDELIKRIQLTPYSRQEYYECKNTWQFETDEIEKARKFYVATMQSVGSCPDAGWGYSKTHSRRSMAGTVSRWLSNVDENLIKAVERLREVQIEHLDIIDLIDKYDSYDTLFYLDPPYVPETRLLPLVYQHEMSIEDHERLINKLLNVKGRVLLSGYDHPLYDILTQNGWNKVCIGEYIKRSQKGVEKQSKGQEIVWYNYNKE